MMQDLSQDDFDAACLRRLAADPEVRRVSLAAAMIKVRALSIARATPRLRAEALEIVEHLERLYAGLPNRDSLARVMADHPAASRLGAGAREDLVEAVWQHFRSGRGD